MFFFRNPSDSFRFEDSDFANLSVQESYEPLYQNRSHYVSSGYATQWKALDAWWAEHGWAVCQLLEPEVEVLFGEWLWARHSVSYNKLPAYFVAFDIYNKRQGRFVSVRERNRRLEGLDLPAARSRWFYLQQYPDIPKASPKTSPNMGQKSGLFSIRSFPSWPSGSLPTARSLRL